MRKSVLVSAVLLLSFLSIFLLPPRTAASPAGKMILPDPSYECPGQDAVLVIDVSGSMKQSDPDYLCREAALRFIDELSHSGSSTAGLITFSDSLQTVIPLTKLDQANEQEHLTQQIRSVQYTAGDTDIGAAMEKAIQLLDEAPDAPSRPRSIFLLTDGEIDLPCAANEEEAEKQSLTRALIAVEDAREDGIVIHTISLDLAGNMDEKLMNYMADMTGGISSKARSAASLASIFRTLSAFAAKQSQRAQETEADPLQAAAMAGKETEAETESESEAKQVPVIRTIGSVKGPVQLSGLLPNLCSATLHLSDLFTLDHAPDAASSQLRYTAWTDDTTRLSCNVDGSQLLLHGLKNGTCQITVIAEPLSPDSPAPVQPLPEDGTLQSLPEDGALQSLPVDDALQSLPADAGQGILTFSVEIHALIPSPWYLALIPACILLLLILAVLLRRDPPARESLSGFLQWYVRGENEKIFGMPSQAGTDLSDYGSKVRLGDLVQDELLAGAALHKVLLTASDSGIRITSKSPSVLIAKAGSQPGSSLLLSGSGRFKVFCDSAGGRAVIIALYTAAAEYKKEPSAMDDSEERTRLLV